MKTVRVRNLMSQSRAVNFRGVPLRFGPSGSPDSVLTLTDDAARYVVELLGDTVLVVGEDETAKSMVAVAPRKEVWLANMTGDPDAPRQVQVGVRMNKKTGEVEPVMEPNPNADPQPLIAELGAQDQIIRDRHGKPWGATLPGKVYNIPAYTCRAFDPLTAEAFLGRDANAPQAHRGRVIETKSPEGALMPEISWSLDELRAYLRLIEPDWETKKDQNGKSIVGPTEAEIRKKHKDERAAFLAVESAKHDLWHRCILRFFNTERYFRPTREEFEQYVAAERAA